MIKFSILATGSIAHEMAETIRELEGIELYAVAFTNPRQSRSLQG